MLEYSVLVAIIRPLKLNKYHVFIYLGLPCSGNQNPCSYYRCRYKVDLLNMENITLIFIKLQVLSRPGSHLGSTDTFVNRSLPLQIDFSSKLFLDFLHKLLSHIVSRFFVSAWVQLGNIQCCDRVDDMNAAK